MAPTRPQTPQAYVFFDNQTDRTVFIRLFPQDGTLKIGFFDFQGKGTTPIEVGQMLAVPVTPAIHGCVHNGKLRVNFQYHIQQTDAPLQMSTPGPIRDLHGRARGAVFLFVVHKP